MEYEGKTYLIASGKKYSPQMEQSSLFLPKSFVLEVNGGTRVFKFNMINRDIGTELLGLEYFAKQKNAVKGSIYPEVVGEIKIFSDLCPCPSCSAVFEQLQIMFPNVKLKIFTTIKLHY